VRALNALCVCLHYKHPRLIKQFEKFLCDFVPKSSLGGLPSSRLLVTLAEKGLIAKITLIISQHTNYICMVKDLDPSLDTAVWKAGAVYFTSEAFPRHPTHYRGKRQAVVQRMAYA
jgi:hypothetical protein